MCSKCNDRCFVVKNGVSFECTCLEEKSLKLALQDLYTSAPTKAGIELIVPALCKYPAIFLICGNQENLKLVLREFAKKLLEQDGKLLSVKRKEMRHLYDDYFSHTFDQEFLAGDLLILHFERKYASPHSLITEQTRCMLEARKIRQKRTWLVTENLELERAVVDLYAKDRESIILFSGAELLDYLKSAVRVLDIRARLK
jgi:hypothetical protein